MSNISGPHNADFVRQQAIRAGLVRPGSTYTRLTLPEAAENSIPVLFEKQVPHHPQRIAIDTDDRVWTYQALNLAANCVAQAIIAQCSRGPEPIGILLEDKATALAVFLGVLKAGKFSVALDSSFPRERIVSTLEEAEASLILSSKQTESLAADVAPAGCQQLNVDRLDFHRSDDADPGLPLSPGDLAAIIFTSGSTGRPKGVVQSHRSLLQRFVAHTNRFCIDSEDRLSMLHSLSTVGSMLNVLGALLNGATIAPFEFRREGVTRVTSWLIKREITILHCPVSLFRNWVDTLSGPEKFPQLRVLRLATEATTLQDVERFKKHLTPGCILSVGLGGTEFAPAICYYIDQETKMPEARVPLGYPMDDVEILLLDEDGHEVAFDQTGEIAIRSCTLAPGYWRQPDLTEARYRPDPRGGDGRIYLTGDLGLRRPNGCLFHMGRKDFQVKIRGYRVETAEIELALHDVDNVKEAAVIAREDHPGVSRLVAYVVPARKPENSVTALRSALAQKLPSYMVPAVFVTLGILPRLPNGKVNRLALPAPDNFRPNLDVPYLAPRSRVEGELTGIWAQVLKLEQVGVHDDFLELGGDSLLAARVISRVINVFKVDLPLRALFAAPSVAQMAVVVTQHQAKQAKPADVERLLAELEALSKDQAI